MVVRHRRRWLRARSSTSSPGTLKTALSMWGLNPAAWLQRDRRRQGKFQALDDDIHQRRPIVGERSLERAFQVARALDAETTDIHRTRDVSEARVREVRAVVQEADGFHLELDERQRANVRRRFSSVRRRSPQAVCSPS